MLLEKKKNPILKEIVNVGGLLLSFCCERAGVRWAWRGRGVRLPRSAVSDRARGSWAGWAGAGLAGEARSERHGKTCGVGSDAGNAIGGILLFDPASQPRAAVGAGFCLGCES